MSVYAPRPRLLLDSGVHLRSGRWNFERRTSRLGKRDARVGVAWLGHCGWALASGRRESIASIPLALTERLLGSLMRWSAFIRVSTRSLR